MFFEIIENEFLKLKMLKQKADSILLFEIIEQWISPSSVAKFIQ